MAKDQVKLPLSVALDVVLQGIRIRFGRSMVAFAGVALGVAFLMSALTTQILKEGAAREEEMRLEVQRRISFLTAETGPPRGKTIGVIQVGPLDAQETRLLDSLARDGLAEIRWAGDPATAPSAVRAIVRPAPLETVGAGASAICVVGDGPAPEADFRELLNDARQKVLILSRKAHRVAPAADLSVTTLERQPPEDQLRKLAEDADRDRLRSFWIVALSLVVTVISIANSMLMSVTERFKEIGTMKCLGACRGFIRRIFLIESAMLGLAGSVAGLVLGAAFSLAVSAATYGQMLALQSMHAGPLLADAALAIAAGVGLSIVAAIYPANVASRMVPAAALRTNI